MGWFWGLFVGVMEDKIRATASRLWPEAEDDLVSLFYAFEPDYEKSLWAAGIIAAMLKDPEQRGALLVKLAAEIPKDEEPYRALGSRAKRKRGPWTGKLGPKKGRQIVAELALNRLVELVRGGPPREQT